MKAGFRNEYLQIYTCIQIHIYQNKPLKHRSNDPLISAVNPSSFIIQIYILVKNCSLKTSEKNQNCSELLVILTDHRLRDHFRPLKYLIWHISYSCSCTVPCQTVVSDNTIKGKRNRIDVVIYPKLQPKLERT